MASAEHDSGAEALPTPLVAYTRYALAGLAVGTALCLFAFVTNPLPDPSFPWATLPRRRFACRSVSPGSNIGR